MTMVVVGWDVGKTALIEAPRSETIGEAVRCGATLEPELVQSSRML